LSGRRPDTTGVWEFKDHFREKGVGDKWVTLPQYFKQFGYLTLGGGKLFHPASAQENVGMDNNDYPASWSPEYPYFKGDDNIYDQAKCVDQGPFPAPPGSPPMENFVWCAVDIPKESGTLYGQQVRNNCLEHIDLATNGSAGNTSRPFFIGCGFHKPHAPYYAPKEFFDKIPHGSEIPLPLDPFAPVGMPEVAWHPYADVAGMHEHPTFNGTVNMTRLGMYRRSYYAAIAFTDYNIGVILEKLEKVGHKNNTIVIVFGDHGYQLGEHDTWAKMTNFELGVHVPLIVRAPWMTAARGRETNVLAEMVDVYPTLSALAGLPDPKSLNGSYGINGTSLLPVFHDPSNSSVKVDAFSQFAKNNIGTSVECRFWRNQTKLMGYTIRTHDWRYTAWFKFDNATAAYPGKHFGRVLISEVLGRELYNHQGDTCKWLDFPGENNNLVDDTQYEGVVSDLHQRIIDYIQIK
jgi:arylsulfatase A-like enzyme